MTIESTVTRHAYRPGSAMAQEALTDVIWLTPSDLVVTRTTSDGTVTTLDLDDNYALGGDGANGAGWIKALSVEDAATIYRIVRRSELIQTRRFPKYQPVDTPQMEGGLDYLMLIAQELRGDADDLASRVLQVPIGSTAPQLDLTGLIDGDLLQFREDKGFTRLPRESFAGMFYAGDATGKPVPANGTGADLGLRADLASSVAGGSLVAFMQGGDGAVKRTMLEKARERVYIQDYGGKADGGLTDNYVPALRALAYLASIGGGDLVIPAGGNYYWLSRGLFIGNGIRIIGTGHCTYPGDTATLEQWAQTGTWLKSTDPVNATLRFVGHGFSLLNVNFMRDQYIPGTGPWSPIIWPWDVVITASHGLVENVLFLNCTSDMIISYTEASGGGTKLVLRDVWFGGLRNGLRIEKANDTIYAANLHYRPLWYMSNGIRFTDLINSHAWDCGYCDNIMIDGFEIVFAGVGIYLFSETCLENTHSLFNAQINNLQLSLNQRGVVADSGAIIRAQIANLICQQGPAFGLPISTQDFFDLQCQDVSLKISNLHCVEAGGTFLRQGDGVNASRIFIDNLIVDAYSTGLANCPLLDVRTNSYLRLGDKTLSPGGGVTPKGPLTTGAGTIAMAIHAWQVFDRFSEVGLTSNGTWQDVSSDYQIAPVEIAANQIRMRGEISINTGVAGGTLQLRMLNFPEVHSIVSAVAAGFQTFDTGWVDISSNIGAKLGRVQVNGTNGVQWGNGSLSVDMR